jgi:hypothetical protein
MIYFICLNILVFVKLIKAKINNLRVRVLSPVTIENGIYKETISPEIYDL